MQVATFNALTAKRVGTLNTQVFKAVLLVSVGTVNRGKLNHAVTGFANVTVRSILAHMALLYATATLVSYR